MQTMGFDCIGGDHSPYIWINGERDSWSFFDLLLQKAGVVCTPGDGFGKCGQGYIRISAFNNFEAVQTAMARIKNTLVS
jgi:LL-diaminopimelate aminotransferase